MHKVKEGDWYMPHHQLIPYVYSVLTYDNVCLSKFLSDAILLPFPVDNSQAYTLDIIDNGFSLKKRQTRPLHEPMMTVFFAIKKTRGDI